MLGDVTREAAAQFLQTSTFIWHQCFELAPEVMTPGVNNAPLLFERARVPQDLTGQTVLDIGTTNGWCAFEAERRGASRVVAVDIYSPARFGFSNLRELLKSRVEFVQGSVYELPEILMEKFDLVLFFGVLYHLRHPLLALDRLRELVRGELALESAVCDFENPALAEQTYVRFYRGAELGKDASNWFAPTVAALTDWMESSGFAVKETTPGPLSGPPARVMIRAGLRLEPPEYISISYERPFTSVRVQQGGRV